MFLNSYLVVISTTVTVIVTIIVRTQTPLGIPITDFHTLATDPTMSYMRM